MEYRRLGRTGLNVPAVTFGGGWVGGVLIHRPETEAYAALDQAWDAGITWIDTAADYGKGVSETVIGNWLRARAPEERPNLSTKFRLNPEDGDFKGQMLRSIDESFTRLGVSSVPLIFLHNQIDVQGTRGSRSLDVGRTVLVADIMDTLRDQRLCDWTGMTALGEPEALHRVMDEGIFDVAQVYYNMLNPTAGDGRQPWNSTDFNGLLKVAGRHDMGTMGIRIFAGGHLASTERHGREIPVTADAGDAAEEARAQKIWSVLGADAGTPAQASLRFGLGCPGLSTIVAGLGEMEHLRLAIDAERRGPLSETDLAAISEAWSDPVFTG